MNTRRLTKVQAVTLKRLRETPRAEHDPRAVDMDAFVKPQTRVLVALERAGHVRLEWRRYVNWSNWTGTEYKSHVTHEIVGITLL